MRLKINDQEQDINFKVNYFFKHFKDLSGKDLLKGEISFEISDLPVLAAQLLYAGYQASKSLKRDHDLIPYEDFEHHCMSMDMATLAVVVSEIKQEAFPEKEPGEVTAQPVEKP